MKRIAAASVLVLLAAACSRPTELASEANARYDKRDTEVAAPPPDVAIDATPIEPEPGSPEAEAPSDTEASLPPPDPAPDALPEPTVDPFSAPAAEPLPPPIEESVPVIEPPVLLPDPSAPG